MIKKIKRAIAESKIAALFIEDNRYGNLVPNINLDPAHDQKRVLFIYLDLFESSQQILKCYNKNESGALHTNRSEFFQIINCLIERNYCIDVCAHDDVKAIGYIEKQEYDIIFGLGEVFRWTVKNKKAYKILYMTENPYYISYLREKERVEYFYQRHHKKVELVRTGKFFKKDEEKNVDAIICMGEKKYFNNTEVYVNRIIPTGFFNNKFMFENCIWKKNSFLVLGTDGFIHKGIDLLIEIFNNHPEWELFICGKDIDKIVKKELNLKIRYSNIHNCGYVNIGSDSFLELVYNCSFILLPSCSEATSTSILTGMRHGLIPVVTKGNGFDEMRDYCYFFESFHLEDIEKGIIQTQKLTLEEIEYKSRNIYEYSNEMFTLCKFKDAMSEALNGVIK